MSGDGVTRDPMQSSGREPRKSQREAKKIAQYTTGMEVIGKGGFGCVWKALDTVTAHTVAIKQLPLKQVGSGSLDDLKMEIDLLSKLKHVNIVKYIDSVKTDNHLNIVLEYVEGGSLASILKKYGAFPEHLCAIYTRQILVGLRYLHLQGVIHRDIKGANVLVTKTGLVKLADFGVAMKLSDNQKGGRPAVGTPFWMAPEIVDMQNPTPACDIWSLGSTVIELATGNHPYSNLEPYQAMYRIVADPHPELPEGITKYLESFLILCFEKDPKKRPSASDLLGDDWILRFKASSKEHSNKSIQSPTMGGGDDDDDEIFDDDAATIRKYVEDKDSLGERTPVKGRDFKLAPIDTKRKSINFVNGDVKETHERGPNASNRGRQRESVTSEATHAEEADLPETMQSGTNTSPTKWLQSTGTRGEGSPKTTESTSRFRFGFLDHFAHIFGSAPANDNQQTVTSEATVFNPSEATGISEKTLNFSQDLDHDAQMKANLKRPDTRLPSAAFRSGEESPIQPMSKISPDSGSHRKEQREADEIKKLLRDIRPFEEPHVLVHTCTKLMELLQPRRKGGISDSKAKLDLVTLHGAVPIVEMLQVTDPELLQTVLKVVNRIIEGNQSFQDNFAMSGLIPAVLKFARPHHSGTMRREAASFVSSLCHSSDSSLQMLVACGGLEALVDLISHDYYHNRDLVWQALDSIHTIFQSASSQSQKSDFCRILAKHGLCIHLTVLIDTLACDIHERASEYLKKVVDLLLLFAREGDTVVKIYMCTGQVLEGLIASLDFLPPDLTVQICRTFKRLAHEPDVLNMLENAGVVLVLVHFLSLHCKPREPEQVEEDRTQNFITRTQTAFQAIDVCWQCMLALYFLCKLSRARQEQAALAGVLPVLQELVDIRTDLRRYAFEMISWMTCASLASRKKLWDQDGIAFFVRSLAFPDLQILALEALVDWLRVKDANWCHKVESVLLHQTDFMGKILALFRTPKADAAVFVKILDPLLKLLRVSNQIKDALAKSDEFFQELVNRLKVQRRAGQSVGTFMSMGVNIATVVETEPLEAVPVRCGSEHAPFSLNPPVPTSNVRRLVSESAVSAGVDVRVRMDLMRLLLLLCEFLPDEERAAMCYRHQLQQLMEDVLNEENKKKHVMNEQMAQRVLNLLKIQASEPAGRFPNGEQEDAFH